jgi:hypothetical protein
MSVAASCEELFRLDKLRTRYRPTNNLVEKESGSFGQTYLLKDRPGVRLKIFKPADLELEEEAVTTCVASKEGISPLFKGAWKDVHGYVNILLEDYELGTLAEYLKTPRSQRECAELDAALMRLYHRMRAGSVCHGDFHPENVVVSRRRGRLEVRAIDFGLSNDYGSCVETDFEALTENLASDEIDATQPRTPLASLPLFFETFAKTQLG